MKVVVEIMESQIKPLYFISVHIPHKNDEEGSMFTTSVNDTHTTIQIGVMGKPKIKFVGEPRLTSLEESPFRQYDLKDFMESQFGVANEENVLEWILKQEEHPTWLKTTKMFGSDNAEQVDRVMRLLREKGHIICDDELIIVTKTIGPKQAKLMKERISIEEVEER